MLKLIRGLINLPPNFSGCVATVGNFDGVHRGHQALVAQLVRKAQEFGLPSVLITFEPQPNEFFAHGGVVPARLMRLREKLTALADLQLDYVLCLRFDQALADLSPTMFIEKILVEKLHAVYVLVGDDFRFGHDRSGNIAVLQHEGRRSGFAAYSMDTYLFDNERVSSSRVRRALEAGQLKAAATLLGRDYGIFGRVSQGHQRGRILGFPTANLFLHRRAAPINGVYAVKVHGLSSKPLYGVANIGNRPTVGGTRTLLEVHLFDFNRDIYGEYIYVEFECKLRDEQRYESLELLQQQILKDAAQARDYFGLPASLPGAS